MRSTILAAALAAIAFTAQAATVSVGYDANAPLGNFQAPGNTSETTAYDVITSQTATSLSVDVKVTGAHAGDALPFSNIYLGGDTSLGIEVSNDRAFDPNVGAYFDLGNSPDFSWHETGSAANGDLDIGFTLQFSFLETDPLGIGFARLGTAASDDFTRVSLSQSFGYSVAGGEADYGDNRLGSFTIPSAVPEPAAPAMMGIGVLALGIVARRRKPARDRA